MDACIINIITILCICLNVVSEVVQTLQLCADRDQSDVVGDLSVCLDGMTVDPEMFATAEADHHSESQRRYKPDARVFDYFQVAQNGGKTGNEQILEMVSVL